MVQPEPKVAGQAPQPPTAKTGPPGKGTKEMSDMRDFIALQQQWQQQVSTMLTQLQPNGGVPLPPPPQPPAAVQASPEELEREENWWARQRLTTTAKLQEWRGKLAEAREWQRRANRAMENAHKHIAHFTKKLQAVESRVDYDEWQKLGKLEPIKWDFDSEAENEDGEADTEDMEDMSDSGEHLHQPVIGDAQPASPFQTPPPPPRKKRITVSNRYACLAKEEPDTAPFAANAVTAFQTAANAPQTQDGADAEARRVARLKTEGPKHKVADYLIQGAILHGATWEVLASDLKLGLEAATQAAAGITPANLGRLSPVSLHVAEAAYQEHVAAQTAPSAIPQTAQDQSSIIQTEMASAGIP